MLFVRNVCAAILGRFLVTCFTFFITNEVTACYKIANAFCEPLCSPKVNLKTVFQKQVGAPSEASLRLILSGIPSFSFFLFRIQRRMREYLFKEVFQPSVKSCRLIESMPRCTVDVLVVCGGPTPYSNSLLFLFLLFFALTSTSLNI